MRTSGSGSSQTLGQRPQDKNRKEAASWGFCGLYWVFVGELEISWKLLCSVYGFGVSDFGLKLSVYTACI